MLRPPTYPQREQPMATSNRSLLLAALRGEEHGDELRVLSRRIIWWEAPAEAMADGDAFVVTVMSDGTGDGSTSSSRSSARAAFSPPPGRRQRGPSTRGGGASGRCD
jgi:hypothetical protein